MHELAETTRSQDRPFGLSRRAVGGISFFAITLLVGLRASCEMAMMSEHGPDAQMGIWVMFLMVKIAFWLLCGGLLAWLLVAVWPKRWRLLIGFVLLLVWAVTICAASWEYQTARQALADASNLSTSPDRLSELVHFDGIQAGYELDNRLASNSSTPSEALRKLYQRNQLGTQMCLARNPKTPKDILEELKDHPDKMVRDQLPVNRWEN